MRRKARVLAALVGVALRERRSRPPLRSARIRAIRGSRRRRSRSGDVPADRAWPRRTRRSRPRRRAYFAYVNAHGGVNGRKINDIIVDDCVQPCSLGRSRPCRSSWSRTMCSRSWATSALRPASRPGATRTSHKGAAGVPRHGRLVLGILRATRRARVRPSRTRSAGSRTIRVKAVHVREVHRSPICPCAKIGILFQNDAFGKNYITGLKQWVSAPRRAASSTAKRASTRPTRRG